MESTPVTEFDIIDEPFQVRRKLFGGMVKYLDYEEKKFANFIKEIRNDKRIQKKFRKHKLDAFLLNFLINKEEVIRFLSIFKYDVDYSIRNFLKLGESLAKMKINHFEGVSSEQLEKLINSKSFQILDSKDIQGRLIVTIDFNKILKINFEEKTFLEKFNSQKTNNFQSYSDITQVSQIINYVLYFFNYIVKNLLTPGKNEQYNIFINMEDLGLNNFIRNYDDLIKIIQYSISSRLNKIFILANSQNSYPAFLNISRYFFETNKEKVILLNSDKLKKIKLFPLETFIDSEIENKTFAEFFIYKTENVQNSMNKSKISKIDPKFEFDPHELENINLDLNLNMDIKQSHIKSLKHNDMTCSKVIHCFSNDNSFDNQFINQIPRAKTHNIKNPPSSNKKTQSETFVKDHFEIIFDCEQNLNLNSLIKFNSATTSNTNPHKNEVKNELINIKNNSKSNLKVENKVNSFSIIDKRECTNKNLSNLNSPYFKKAIKREEDYFFILDKPRDDTCCKFEACNIF